jgi:RNA polymerase sigma-32 factor
VPESDVREMDVRLSSSEKSLDAPVGDAEGRSIARIDMVPLDAAKGPSR